MADPHLAPTGPAFVGRRAELARLAEAAAAVCRGSPRAAWVLGEPGIGKTALARRAVEALPRGFTVLDAAADPAEQFVEFGVVDQLVRQVAPGTLRAAPSIAPPISPRTRPAAAGTALLGLLGVVQSAGPVALVVDDAHWMDAHSAQALAFVLRRIRADQVLVVLTSRHAAAEHPHDALRHLERSRPDALTLELTGLTAKDVRVLARIVRGVGLPAAAGERLRAHTRGNPLHLRTLLRDLSPDQVADDRVPLPVPRSFAAATRSIVDRLPAHAVAVVEALAVLEDAVPPARAAYVAGIPDVNAAVAPAVAADLVCRGGDGPTGRIRIRHGLYRDAVYAAIAPGRRATLHRRAADVTDHTSHWAHRVAAAATADPALATQLDDAACRAAAAGHHPLAARYARWAADLSTDRADHERRLLYSGIQAMCGPDRAAALALLPEFERCADSPLRSLTLGLIALFGTGDWLSAVRHFSDALDRSRGSGDWVEAVAEAGLSGARLWSGHGGTTVDRTRHALRLGGLPVRLVDFTTVILATARCRADGMAGGLSELDHLPADPADVPPEWLDSLACRGAIRVMLGRFTEAERDLHTTIRRHDAGSHLLSGTTPHSYLAALHYARGEWDRASVLVHQALSLADPDEQPHHVVLRHMVACLVPAGRGEWATASAHVNIALAGAERAANPQDTRYAAIAGATLYQARGLPAEMLTALRPLVRDEQALRDGTHVWWQLWWRPLFVEALIGTGRRTEAAEQMAVLREVAAGVDYLKPTLLRFELALRPTLSLPDTAARVAELARQAHAHSFPQALLEATVGARAGAAAAVPFLRSALDRFTALRATPFEQRVRRLLSTETAAQAAPVSGLSRREEQIAHLVSLNQTNREVAAQLFITTKTVEYHLGNIYLKLGVSGRRQLRERMTAGGAHPSAPP